MNINRDLTACDNLHGPETHFRRARLILSKIPSSLCVNLFTNTVLTSTGNMDDGGTTNTTKHFRLLDLPRELRDQIYRSMMDGIHQTCPRGVIRLYLNPCLMFTHHFDPNVRLVCQQVKDEFEEEFVRVAELIIHDIQSDALHVGWQERSLTAMASGGGSIFAARYITLATQFDPDFGGPYFPGESC